MGWHAVTIKRGNEGGIKDRKKIEQDAVNAVNLCFRGVNRVSADILTNDSFLLFDGCNYRSLLFTNPLFRGLFHF